MSATSPQASADSARETVQKLFAALGGGDIDGVIGLLAPDVTWFVPGDRSLVPWVGTWSGHEEMREFFAIIAKVAEPRAFELYKILDDENDVVVLGRFAYFYPSSGQVFDDQFAMHFTVVDGKITSYRIHEDSYALANAFTGR